MLFILLTLPVAFNAEFELIRNSVLVLPELLNIQVVTKESESGESARNMVRDIVP